MKSRIMNWKITKYKIHKGVEKIEIELSNAVMNFLGLNTWNFKYRAAPVILNLPNQPATRQ
jgi:hypothetical protein